MDARSTRTLNNGVEIPVIGLGTWKMADGDETESAVRHALDIGYRLIDTATLYGNERSVGKAVRESGIARSEIFVTTKLWPTDFFDPAAAFEKSYTRLGLDHIDLYLIHWPIPLMPKSVWQALERIYDSKRVRAIGISNFGIGDIEKLLEYARVVPAVNQIKFNPFDFAEEVLGSSRSHGITVEAYTPLTRGSHLTDATVAAIAHKHGKSAAQVMLRWCVEHGTIPLPKSTHPVRMRENLEIFDFALDAGDMRKLDALT